jgi:RNA polymerase sigma-70 factor, ECF subfamily
MLRPGTDMGFTAGSRLGAALPPEPTTHRGMIDDFPRLIAAARQGEEAAFTTLFRSVQPLLLRYLRTVGRDLADDVAAETWLSVVRGLGRFRGDEDGFRAWVFTIARARLVDARRSTGRVPVPVDAQAELEGRPGSADVETAVHELMSTEAALELIGRLPPDQAEAVLLRHLVGLDVAHAAQVLGKRPGAVRIATMRGLQRLRSILGPASVEADAPGCNATDRASG